MYDQIITITLFSQLHSLGNLLLLYQRPRGIGHPNELDLGQNIDLPIRPRENHIYRNLRNTVTYTSHCVSRPSF